MTDGERYDLTVIGSGPGGYVAAIRAAQLGQKVAIVEADRLGGVCLNWGCIPTKALLRSAEVYRLMKHAETYGLSAGGAGFDIGRIVKRSRDVSARLQQGVGYLLRKNKVDVVTGTARIEKPGVICVVQDGGETVIESRHIILATGARPLQLKGLEADGRLIWTYKEALMPDEVPRRLLVVGAGAIGLEFASFYRELGAHVTVIEALSHILPACDGEISGMLRLELEKQGIDIRTSTFLRSMDKGDDVVTATLESNGVMERVMADRVLLAMGVVGNVEGLGLEATRVRVERGVIRVDEWLRTDEPGIYAIGDVAGPPCLAHKASHEGVICVEKIAGLSTVHPLECDRIPYCTFTYPQVASVGLTEQQSLEKGRVVKVGRFPFAANGKAIALGETEGLIKVVFDADSGELLGAHMIGAEVTEMIQGYGIAMGLETTESDLERTVFAHPTLSEMMHEAVLAALKRAIHI